MAGAEHGGAEAFFVRLVLALHRAGVEQKVLIRENKERARVLKDAGVDLVELPFGGKFDLKTKSRFKDYTREFKPDVVMTWMNRATEKAPKGDFVHVARLGGYYDLKYYRDCDHLIGNTEDIVDYLVKQGWEADKAHYLPNFVSEDQADPVPRKSLYTPNNAHLVFALGRLHENKAFDVLLKAIAQVPNVYLWLAGEGPIREELEVLAERIGIKPRVRFLGWRDDAPALFAAADLFICPSRHEPLGNVVLEGWAQGLPVIAADAQGPGTLIEPLENGVLVPVDDADAMARAIRAVIADNEFAQKIAANGRATFEEHFTERSVVQHYLRFFQDILTNTD